MGTAPSRSPCTASSVSSRYSSRSTSWLYRVRSTSTAFPSPRWVITTSSSSERRSSTEASSSRSCLVPTTVTDITFNGTTSCTIGENASQYGRVDVPARDDADELPRPGPARQSGRDTEGSGSFGDHSGAFREQPDGSRGLLERRNERPVHDLADERPHLLEHGSGAGPVHERRPILDLLRRAGCERGRERRGGLRLDGVDAGLGPKRLDRARDPDGQPSAAERNQNEVGIGEVFEQLQPDRPVPRHHQLVLDRMDEEALDALEARFGERLPPALVRNLHDRASEALDRLELRLRRVLGDDHRARDARLPRGPSDPLGHVAGARGDDARLDLLARSLPDRVRRPPDLERADRLQVLELEVDLGLALRGLQADQNSTAVPIPRSCARRRTYSAAARSSTASPSERKTVISSSSWRPGFAPMTTSPSSARM